MNGQTTQRPPRYDIEGDARVLRVTARALGMAIIGFGDPRLANRWHRLQRNRKTLVHFPRFAWGGNRGIGARLVPGRRVGRADCFRRGAEKNVARPSSGGASRFLHFRNQSLRFYP